MKLHLPKFLRAALIACLTVVAPIATTVVINGMIAGTMTFVLATPQAQAADYDEDHIVTVTDNTDVATYLSSGTYDDGYKVIMDMDATATASWISGGTWETNVDEIEVVSWGIGNGSTAYLTFNSVITGSGDIDFRYNGPNRYYFTEDMSAWSGNAFDSSSTNAKTVLFIYVSDSVDSATRTAASGTGVIDINGSMGYTFYHDTTVDNTTISAATISFDNGDSAATSNVVYTVNAAISAIGYAGDSATSAIDSAITIGANTTVNLNADMSTTGSLTLGENAVLSIATGTSVSVGTSLSTGAGASILNSGSMVISSDASMTVAALSTVFDLSSTGSLTLSGTLDFDGALNTETASMVLGSMSLVLSSDTIFDLGDSVADGDYIIASVSGVTGYDDVTISGLSEIQDHAWSYENGELVLSITTSATVITWDGGDVNWTSSDIGGADFSSSAVIFFGTADDTSNDSTTTVTLTEGVTAYNMTVQGADNWIFASSTTADSLTITNDLIHTSTGTTTISADVVSMGSISVDAGTLNITTISGTGTPSGDITVATDAAFNLGALTDATASLGALTISGSMVVESTNAIEGVGAITVDGGSLSFNGAVNNIGTQSYTFQVSTSTATMDVSVLVTGDGSVSLGEGTTIAGVVLLESGTVSFNSQMDEGSTYILSSGLYVNRANLDDTNIVIIGDNTTVIAMGGAGSTETTSYDNYTLSSTTIILGANALFDDNVDFWYGDGTLTITGADGVTNDDAGTYKVSTFLTGFTSGGTDVTVKIGKGAIFEVAGTTTTSSGSSTDSFVATCSSSLPVTFNIDGALVLNSGISTAGTSTFNIASGGTLQMNAGVFTASGVTADMVVINLVDGSNLVLGDQGTTTSGTCGEATVNIAGEVNIASNDVDEWVDVDTAFTYTDGATVNLSAGADNTLAMNAGITGTSIGAVIDCAGTVQLGSSSTLSNLTVTSGSTLSMAEGASLTVTSSASLAGTIALDTNNQIDVTGATITLTGALSFDVSNVTDWTLNLEDGQYYLTLLNGANLNDADLELLSLAGFDSDGKTLTFYNDGTVSYALDGDIAYWTTGGDLTWDTETDFTNVNGTQTIEFADSDAVIIMGSDTSVTLGSNVSTSSLTIGTATTPIVVYLSGGDYELDANISILGTSSLVLLDDALATSTTLTGSSATSTIEFAGDGVTFAYNDMLADYVGTILVSAGTLDVAGADLGTIAIAGGTVDGGDTASTLDSISMTGGTLSDTSGLMSITELNITDGDNTLSGVVLADSLTISGGTTELTANLTATTSLTVSGGDVTFSTSSITSAAFFQSGGTITFAESVDLTNFNETVYAGTMNIELEKNVTVNVNGGAASDTGTYVNRYQNGSAYTVNIVVNEGAVYSDNVKWWTKGGTFDVSGGGTVQLTSLLLDCTSSQTTLTIGEDTTLEIMTTGASTTSGFGLSGAGGGYSTTEIYGKLIINGIIYTASTSTASVINVYDGGTMVLNAGLGLTGSTSIVTPLNVYGGGTLSVGNQTDLTDTSEYFSVNMADSSTITDNGVDTLTTVYTALVFADDATVNFVSSGDTQTLSLAFDVTGTNISAAIAGEGAVAFEAGATLTSATVAAGSTLSIEADASIDNTTVSGALSIAEGVTLTGAIALNGGSLAITTDSISNALSVTAAGSSISTSASGLSLNSTISYDGSSSLSLAAAGTVSFGDDFMVDIADISVATYLLFTDLDADTDISSLSDDHVVNSDTSLYKYSWLLDSAGNLSLMVTDLSAVLVWDGSTDTWANEGSGWADSSIFTNEDNVKFDATGAANSAVTVADAGVNAYNITITGDTDYSFSGGAISGVENLIVSETSSAVFNNSIDLSNATVTISEGSSLTLSESLTIEILSNEGTLNMSGLTLTLTEATVEGGHITADSLTLMDSDGYTFGNLQIGSLTNTGNGTITLGDGTVITGSYSGGPLVIADGATVQIGSNDNGVASLTVGEGAQYTISGMLFVGTGSFTNEGAIIAGEVKIGCGTTQGGTISGTDYTLTGGDYTFTKLTATGSVSVSGALTLTEGGSIEGSLSATSLTVGAGDLSVGSLDSESLSYGTLSNGAGTLSIGDGSATGNTLVVSGEFSNSGTLDAAGYSLSLSDTDVAGGVLKLTNLSTAGSLSLDGGSAISGSLTASALSTTGNVSVGSLTNSALSELSNSTGTLIISGSSSTTLTIDELVNAGTIDMAGYSADITTVTAGGSLSVASLNLAGAASFTSLSTTGTLTTGGALSTTGDMSIGGSTITLGGALQVGGSLSLGVDSNSLTSIAVTGVISSTSAYITAGSIINTAAIDFEITSSTLTGIGMGNKGSYVLAELGSDYVGDVTLWGSDSFTLDNGGTMQIAVDADGNITLYYSIDGSVWDGETWGSGQGGDWESGAVPSETDVVMFTGQGSSTVTVVGDQTVLNVVVDIEDGAAVGSYTFTGEDSSINTNSFSVTSGAAVMDTELNVSANSSGTGGDVVVGSSSSDSGSALAVTEKGSINAETMTINSSYAVDEEGNITQGFANSGTTTINGALNAQNASILNDGTLSIGDGSVIANVDGVGTTIVTGVGTTATFTDFAEEGTLAITTGATATFTGDATLGSLNNEGTLNVVGSLSLTGSISAAGDIKTDKLSLVTASANDISVNTLELTSLEYVSAASAISVMSLSSSADYVLSADSISSADGSTSIELNLAALTQDTAEGEYYLIQNTGDGDGYSWGMFELSADTQAVVSALFSEECMNVQFVTTETGDLVLVLDKFENLTWYTSDNCAIGYDDEGNEMVVIDSIYNESTGVLNSYDVLDLVEVVNVDKDLTISIDGIDDDSEDKNVTINNLTGDETKTLTIQGNSEGSVTLNNTSTTVALNKVLAEDLDLIVENEDGSITLANGSTGTTYVSLTLAELELDASTLTVVDGSKLTVNSLTADEKSTIAGLVSLGAGVSILEGSYDDATLNAMSGAIVSVDVSGSLGSGLTITGGAGSFILDEASGGAIDKIATTGANIYLGEITSDGALTLTEASSMVGGTLIMSLDSSDVLSDTTLVATKGNTISLDGTSIVIAQSDNATVLNFEDDSSTITLVQLNSSSNSSVSDDCSFSFEGAAFEKYFSDAYYDKDTATIIATRNDSAYNSMAVTENGAAGLNLVSKALLELNPETDSDTYQHLTYVMEDMDAYKAAGAYGAADALASAVAGSTTTSLGSAAVSDVERQLRSIRNRTKMMGVDPSVVNEAMPYYNAWIAAEGGSSTLDAESTHAGHKLNNFGGSIGADVDLTDMLSVGASFSALYGDLTSDGADSAEGDFNTMYGSLFARINSKRWTHSFVATFGAIDATLDRTVSTTSGSYKTKGETDGFSYGLMYEVGYTYAVTEDASTCIQPLFNVALVNSTIDGYTETGSDAALMVGDQDNYYVTFGLGGLLETVVGENMYNRASVLSARAMMKFDAGDRQSEADVTLVHSPTYTETVKGAEVGAVGVELGLGLTIPVTEEVGAIFMDVSCEFRSGMTNVNGSVGYRFSF